MQKIIEIDFCLEPWEVAEMEWFEANPDKGEEDYDIERLGEVGDKKPRWRFSC